MCIYRVFFFSLFECFPFLFPPEKKMAQSFFLSSSSPQELSPPSSLLLQFSNHRLPILNPLRCESSRCGTQYCAMEKAPGGRIGSMALIKPFIRVSTSEAERALYGVRTSRPCVEARVPCRASNPLFQRIENGLPLTPHLIFILQSSHRTCFIIPYQPRNPFSSSDPFGKVPFIWNDSTRSNQGFKIMDLEPGSVVREEKLQAPLTR